MLALVWIAGPLTGVLVQPYIGIKSDRCQIKWGRRRPFILGGALGTIVAIMILAWTREIVSGFLSIFGVDPQSRGVAITIMLFAVLFIYVLDIAINVLQAAIRAFIVDCAPTHQQESANAWVSRISGFGNIIGMFCGGLNLPALFPFFGHTQFKVLCAIAAISMFITAGVSSASIAERDPTLYGKPAVKTGGVFELFRDLWQSVRRLPPQISKICQVQFFAWMGWFPFLFYTTTFIGEIYVDPILAANPNMTADEIDKIWEKGTRLGTTALLVFAITTFLSSVFLPFIIPPTYKPPSPSSASTPGFPLTPTGSTSSLPLRNQPSLLQRTQTFAFFLLSKLQIRTLTLRRAWFLAHIVFAITMFLTFFVHSVTLATILVGFVGVPWSLTQWAPFALMAAEISKRDAIRRGLLKAPPTSEANLLVSGEDDAADQAGVVLGIHNVAVSAPQVVATLVSSLIFKLLARPRGVPGDNSVAWCLRFGGVCMLVAAWLTVKVGEDGGWMGKERAANGTNGRFRDEDL
ncbi:hypothetical protein EJ08DRAFT_425805 [Tothia fuscella]|uniref:MFS transporter n=1 Tax=Tothia fuscella TaxID=1048955 RepID=A0A9P4P0L1_9PEZI|nr:hypothetical protein EJ08DRAFT_425805 [Tothia fuscella]